MEDSPAVRLVRMLAVDGEVAELSVDGEPVGWLGCSVTTTRAVPGRWWRRARLGEVWLDYLIEWTSPVRLQNGYGDFYGSAHSDADIDALLSDWEACVHHHGAEALALRWVSANEAQWARYNFGWPAPFALRERNGWGGADDGFAKLLTACASAAITKTALPGSAQGSIGFKAIRVDDDSLALSRESRPPEVPFGLWFPESLDRIEEIDATKVVLTSTDLFEPEPLYGLPSTVESLALHGAPVRPASLRLDRLKASEVIVGWAEVDPGTAISPTIRRLSFLDSGPSSLADIPASEALEELDIGAGHRLTSLEGLERFPNLKVLEVSSGRRLEDISDLGAVPSLRRLEFDGCRKVGDFSPASVCRELTQLWLVDCGEVTTIGFVRDLRELTGFGAIGTTKILDGDLAPLLEAPHLTELALARRRHYRPATREVHQRLGIPY